MELEEVHPKVELEEVWSAQPELPMKRFGLNVE